jgi:ABC-type branched-subunit amino acid transport system substrate-binding protein
MTLHAHPLVRALVGAAACLGPVACGGSTIEPADAGPVRAALFMPLPPGSGGLPPAASWAQETVNAGGGIRGRKLEIEVHDQAGLPPEEIAALGAELSRDDKYVAVLGGGSSLGLFLIADAFVEAQKPLVNYTSTAADVLRAYAGKDFVWRTRKADIAQTELLLRFAEEQGAARVALVASLDANGISFFDWFGFFAAEMGLADDAVTITGIGPHEPCDAAVAGALAGNPDILFAAPGDPMQQDCIAKATVGPRKSGLRVVYADAGLDPLGPARDVGPDAFGMEGFSTIGDPSFEQAFHQHLGGRPLPPHGASEYDAVLLLAYGLTASDGHGGQALADGMKSAVSATSAETHGWDDTGVAGALAALAAGRRPSLLGASGPLRFEPEIFVDLTASRLTHVTLGPDGLVEGEQYWTGDSQFLSSEAPLPPASEERRRDALVSSGWTPASGKTDAWAVIAALSSGWANYRHQSDALRQYQLLKAGGIDDDHIILIVADDLAHAAENRLEGTVRNEVGGPNVDAGVKVDYGLNLTAADLSNILTGTVTATTPTVLHTTASSNLYVYLAGHGGTAGMPIGAPDPSAGLEGGGEVLSPTLLREALCSLRISGRLRRALVLVETCHGGSFGEAALGGVEKGCGPAGSETPLGGVALLSAATSKEDSLAGKYDPALSAWVNDAFSRELARRAAPPAAASLSALYADVYLRVSGSHVSLYNAASAGNLGQVALSEFITP